MTEPRIPWLHVYGQQAWHDPVHIVGTHAGLALLRDAVLAALVQRPPLYGHAFVRDGEGYTVVVMLASEPTLDDYCTPYTADEARDPAASQPTWPRRTEEQP